MSTYSSLLTPTGTRRLQSQKFEIRPTRPWANTSPWPQIVDLPTFAEVHQRADDRIKLYLEYQRRHHSQTASYDAIFGLRRENAHALYANNNYSRIAFAEIALRRVLEHPHIQLGPCCYVTITPACFAFPMEDHGIGGLRERLEARRGSKAAKFDIRKLQQVARQALGAVPFIGMVEFAPYRHWSPSGPAPYDTISWHTHLFAWGGTADDIRPLLNPLRRRHSSLLPRVSAVYVEDIKFHELILKMSYINKAPQKLSRVEFWRDPGNNSDDPMSSPGTWKTNKDWLRTGQRVRLLDVMADRTLDRLIFGNSDGTSIVSEIRSEALEPFLKWKRRHRRFGSQ